MEMTELSTKMQEKAMHIDSVEKAEEVLLKSGNFRSLGDTLKKFSKLYKYEDLKNKLREGLLKQRPTANKDSIDRKLRNWLNGNTNSISKEEAFCLCLIFNLKLPDADDFLKEITGEGFHWRSPDEIIWAYGIKNELSYEKICSLLKDTEEMQKQVERQNKNNTSVHTEEVFKKVLPMLDISEELFLCELEKCIPEMGNFHNTAYDLFINAMGLLKDGGQEKEADPAETNKNHKSKSEDDDAFTIRKMSTKEILEIYFYRKLIPAAKRTDQDAPKKFSDIQRSIYANWPNEATISAMRNRKTDVTRKVLILLFLATDGSETEYEQEDNYGEEPEMNRNERFQSTYIRLNRMLKGCGFQLLDPRSPFDWLTLYCISVDDIWDIDQRMAEILASVFPNTKEEAEQ